MTGVAATMGAAVATPAVAAGTVPVPVPLDGVENALNVKAPKISGELPVPMPGGPRGPRYVEGRLIPEHVLPQLPVNGGLPGANVHTPLPHVLGDGFDHFGVGAPAADLRTLTPGLSLDTPLTAPKADHFGLPDAKLPQVAVLTPLLKTVPAANLDMGAGA
ncbi:hypothetical protein GCM10011579_013940 [Streptomyces albiflavescens]|uniref:Secreted protein n=2 Tax=Streptomyces albiflavescens TaxID=1623582 RepID=A0A917XVZ6_9ACTN|nr:hypothetical protein GCM10011579_013940 [Streptomyces albiflavescens]